MSELLWIASLCLQACDDVDNALQMSTRTCSAHDGHLCWALESSIACEGRVAHACAASGSGCGSWPSRRVQVDESGEGKGACAPNSADGGRCKRSLYILIRQLSFHPPCLACCCIACRCQEIGHLRPPTRPSAASIAASSAARRGHSQSTGAHLVAFIQSTPSLSCVLFLQI